MFLNNYHFILLNFTLAFQHLYHLRYLYHLCSHPAGTQRPEDVHLWSYFGRNVLDHNRTKIGRIMFLTYFGSAMSDLQLASGNIGKISLKTYFMDDD